MLSIGHYHNLPLSAAILFTLVTQKSSTGTQKCIELWTDQKQTDDSDLVQSKGTKTICIIYIKLLKRKRYNDDDDEINPVDTD